MKKAIPFSNNFEKFPDFVREKKNSYPNLFDIFKPYFEREDLTASEKVCIGNYQDIQFWNSQKHDWSCQIPAHMKEKPWCYMINSCCRFPEFYKNRTDFEKELIDFNIRNIDSAIEKSRIENDGYFAYRGIPETTWMKSLEIGEIFADKAYNSFSLNQEIAALYTNPEKEIILRIELIKKMKGLYLDEVEYEILRPRNIVYKIVDIEKEKTNERFKKKKETIILTIKEWKI